MENLTEAELFAAIVQERDSVRNQYNEHISKLLRPVTLTALFQLFQLPTDKVEWGAFDLIEDCVVVVVYVTYKSSDQISPFLQMMDKIANSAKDAKRRMIKLAVPVNIAFSTVDEVKQYLYTSAEKYLTPPMPVDVPQTEFNPSELTEEQLKQLKLYHVFSTARDKQ